MKLQLNADYEREVPSMIALRRDIHSHPELSFEEERTAGLVADGLRKLGLEVITGVGGTGVTGLLRGVAEGKTLLIRADMDALPVEEVDKEEFCSRAPGIMHAWGHDGHVAVAMSVASVLAGMRDDLKGNVKFAFQPAEETAGGALGMIEAGALEDPKVDAALALHIINSLEAGKIGVRVGGMFASVDEFTVRIRGRGGHAAHPESLVDPILVSSQAVSALHQIVGRNVGALESAVLSVGMIKGGTAFNIIPDEVELKGTVRAFDDATRDRVMARMEEVLTGITSGAGASYEIEDIYQSPVVINDADMASVVRRAARKAIGEENVVECEPSMGGDDQAYFQREVPGCYFIVGGGNEEKGYGPHHSRTFGFDERALEVGLRVMTEAALEYLGRG